MEASRYSGLIVAIGPLLLLLLASLFLPLPYSPIEPNVDQLAQAPGPTHLLGTDASGFDVFSRIIAAAKHDLPLAVGGTLAALLIGLPLGLLASARGWVGGSVMRGVDALQAFPLLVISVAIVTLAGNRIEAVIFAIVLVNAPAFIRLVRSEAIVLRESRFVEAAIAIGCAPSRVMGVHILPNVLGLVLVQSSLSAASAIVVIAALNFLGVGVSPPEPTWGSMVQIGANKIAQGFWWMSLFPGLVVFVVVSCLNLTASSLNNLVGEG
jgi:ABC-type dipeptide/oligopeptide/nickel transport system permease subunit